MERKSHLNIIEIEIYIEVTIIICYGIGLSIDRH
jgi:hypothetical protein